MRSSSLPRDVLVADLANMLNEGAIIAARKNEKIVTMSDLFEARDKVFFGREHRRVMDSEERSLTAYHEAGHALVQALIDDGKLPVHKVTIIPRGQSLGSTMFMPTKDITTQTRGKMLNQICASLGGRVAEEIVFSDITNGASGDIKSAGGHCPQNGLRLGNERVGTYGAWQQPRAYFPRKGCPRPKF
ncbi:MAG: hypothetical protein ACLUKN_11485 [Bacilli bacterium]